LARHDILPAIISWNAGDDPSPSCSQISRSYPEIVNQFRSFLFIVRCNIIIFDRF